MKPEDRKGDFTFSRSTYATRVGPTGLIEKETQNLLSYSNTFDNVDWAKSNASVTSGHSGYDGSSDAWKFIEAASFTEHQLKQNFISSGVHTLSIVAKSAERDFLFFRMNLSSSWTNAVFNLADGTVASTGGFIYADITSLGNGWYRCSAAFTNLTGSTIQFQIGETASNFYYTGIDGYGIYIQDAQLEQGLVARDYIETTTTAIYGGITDNVPRLDYQGSCPALLLEPQRTNLMTNSEYVTGSNINVTTSFVEGPEGLNNATRLTETAVSGQHYTSFSEASVTSGTKYTISFFVKKGGYDTIKVYTQSSRINFTINFTFSTETITGSGLDYETNSVKAEDYGNGWYRLSGVATANSTGGVSLYANPKDLSNYLGDTSKYTDYYGVQIEEGSYATSYIPTYGSAVTRNAEGQSYGGFSSLIGQTEGTLFLEIDSTENNTEVFSLNRSTANAVFLDANANFYRVFTWADGTTNSQFTTIANTDRIKIAVAYKSNDFAIYANGSQVATNNTLTWTPNITIDTLNFNVGGYVTSKGVARYKQVMLIPERISNEELAQLTAL
jgi:hypothetical protein